MQFIGRHEHFRWLDKHRARVSPSRGLFLVLRGRRQVGKSRLLTEWLRGLDGPHLYYQALNRTTVNELESFREAVARSRLGAVTALARSGAVWPDWNVALEALEIAVRDAGAPVVVVLDELPYIVANDDSFEATLQAAWDHRLQHCGILLIAVGSDLALMEALSTYGRPLYQRIDAQKTVEPLSVAEVAKLLGVDARTAFDTYLMTGGFPKVVAARAEQRNQKSFLREALSDEAHPLVFTGQQMLAAEFPPAASARAVLSAVGHGERSFGAIQQRAGVSEKGLVEALTVLKAKGVVAADDPLAARRVRGRTRYSVADPYLRFWLRFLEERVDDVARGRGDLVLGDIEESWQDYAGTAVEPLVRAALDRMLPDERFGDAQYTGAFWSRDNQVQMDLTGTRERDGSEPVSFVGSVKWRASRPFGRAEALDLDSTAVAVPGAGPGTRRVGVSRTGFARSVALDATLGPDDLLAAWADGGVVLAPPT